MLKKEIKKELDRIKKGNTENFENRGDHIIAVEDHMVFDTVERDGDYYGSVEALMQRILYKLDEFEGIFNVDQLFEIEEAKDGWYCSLMSIDGIEDSKEYQMFREIITDMLDYYQS